MSFWLATLNPGKKRRRGGRRLSKWQRMVKKYGGVQAALKARRAGKRGRRRVGRKHRRRLSKWQRMVRKYGGVKAALKVRRGHRRAKRAMSRRRLRRSAGKVARRNGMARTRRRGRRSASRKGRRRRNSWFGQPVRHARASRKGWRRRRRRRNPVVPVSWNPPRKRRRSRRRNPWARVRVWRTKSGRFGVRGGRRRRRRNPVIPVSWNPRRRRRRSYRRNGVLPIQWNPVGAITAAPGQILGRLKEFVDVGFWTETALPAVGGFVGSKTVGAVIYGFVGEKLLKLSPADKVSSFVRIGCNAIGGAGLSFVAGHFLKNRKMAENIWLGTVIGVAHSVLKELIGGTEIARTIGLDGLGEDLSSRMREAVARRVEQQLSGDGMGHYLTQRYMAPQSMNGLNEFITDTALRRQPGYSALPSGSVADYDIHSETVI